MKLLIIVCLAMGVSSFAFGAPKQISKKELNRVIKNHLIVAKVKQPGYGLKLFDTCVDGNVFKSISNTPATRCVEWYDEVVDDTKFDPFPQSVRRCGRWETFTPQSKVERLVQKSENCRWVLGRDHPNEGLYEDKQHEFVQLCDYKSVVQGFPLTQVIEIYNLYDNFYDRIYWHSSHEDRAQPGYRRRSYTIPSCMQ